MIELQQIVEKWDWLISKGQLAQDMTAKQTALMLEHQRLYNETLSDVDSDVTSYKFLSSFKRMSIPIVWRTLHYTKTPQLVDFQPVANTTEQVEDHLMKTILLDPTGMQSQFNLDAETEAVTCIAQELAVEIDMLVLNELRVRAGIVCYIDPTNPSTDFNQRYWEIAKEVGKNSGAIPNWVVASSPVAEYLTEAIEFSSVNDDYAFTSALGIRRLGVLYLHDDDHVHVYAQDLYENTLTSDNELLLGYKGSPKSFKFCPRVLLEAVPTGQPNQKIQKARIRTQFNTIWPKNGGDLYARITVKAPD